MRLSARSILSSRSRTFCSIDRSFSRSKVALPASADSSSRPTSPESSDWVVENASSSIVVSWVASSVRSSVRRARSSSTSFFVSLLSAMVGEG